MEVAPGVRSEEPELESDLVDLSDVSLETIGLLPDSVLSASLRRILTDNDAPERYAAFQNHI
jgi:FXSXX-COOH protein